MTRAARTTAEAKPPRSQTQRGGRFPMHHAPVRTDQPSPKRSPSGGRCLRSLEPSRPSPTMAALIHGPVGVFGVVMNWGSPRDHENVASTEQANRKRLIFRAVRRGIAAFLQFSLAWAQGK